MTPAARLVLLACCWPAWAAADTLLPLTRHDAVGDRRLAEACLLATLLHGRVYQFEPGAVAPVPIAPTDLLVTEDVRLEDLRVGDAIVVRTSSNPLPYASDPVGLRRVAARGTCQAPCAALDVRLTSARGPVDARLTRFSLVGRVVYALDREAGGLKVVRDPDVGRSSTLPDAFNSWRPRWSAAEVARRLEDLRRPTLAVVPLPAFPE
jgi:hypothetical protein